MRHRLVLSLTAAIVLGTAACGEHPLYSDAPWLEVTLNPDSTLLLAIGQTHPLQLTVRDGSGRIVNPPLVQWESSDPQTIAVDQSGWITSLADGNATITVRVGDAGRATAGILVKSKVMSRAWISAVANRELDPSDDRDSTAVQFHERSGGN